MLLLISLGHTEKAVCLLQCMTEFNLCSSKTMVEDLQQKKNAFEEFFDSGLPRYVCCCDIRDARFLREFLKFRLFL